MIKTASSIMTFLFLFAGLVYTADRGTIAVEWKSPNAQVSKAAARSLFFLIFDGSGALLETVDNPYKTARKKASASVIPFLEQKGVTMIVAGNFGDNMIQAMKDRGIEALEFRGSAEEAVKTAKKQRKTNRR